MNLPIFLIISLVMRLAGFLTPAIWYDEAVTYYRASLPWSMYITDISDVTGPNAWEIFLRAFSTGPVWLLRLPALISAIIALYIAWRLMDRLNFTLPQRITASIPMAILPGLLWQAQDARYYAVMAALYLGAIWYALNNRWMGLFACAGLLVWIQPVGIAYGASVVLIALLNRMKFKHIVLISVGLLAAWIPRYAFLFLRNDQFWLTSVDGTYALIQTVQSLFVNTLGPIGMISSIGFILAVVIVSFYRSRSTRDTILITAAVLPAGIMLLISLIQPVYFYRPVQPLCISFCMLVGWLLAPGKKWYSWIAPAGAAILLLVGFMNYSPVVRGGGIDQAATSIRKHWQAGDKIIYIAPLTAFPFDHYVHDLDHCILEMDIGPNVGPPVITGFEMCPLDDLTTNNRSWLIWIREPAVAASVHASMQQITAGLVPVFTTNAWQFAPIEIYLLDHK